MTSLIRILFLLVLLVTAAPVAPALAQDLKGVEDAAPAAIPVLAVTENEATAEFPEGITFSLDAETTDPIANLELLYRAPGMETLSVELPPFEAGATEVEIEHPIDLRAGELPVGIDVQYRWRITEADGDVVETPEQTLSWFDDRYDWTPLSGPNVTVYTYDADPAFQQAILDAAERTVTSLAESYGAELEQPVRVWAYADKDHLYGALAPNSEPWIAGAAYPALHVIMAVLPPGTTTRWGASSRMRSAIRCCTRRRRTPSTARHSGSTRDWPPTGRRMAATASIRTRWSSPPPARCLRCGP
jgi:hypothetical protein